MLYLYRNKYNNDIFLFDSVRLIRYEIDDKRLVGARFVDMEKSKMKSPYVPNHVHYSDEDCIILTKGNILGIWYNWYSYIIEFDEAVYMNNELICGAFNMGYRKLHLEYAYFDKKRSLILGVGLKNGSIRITGKGNLYLDGEKYSGRYESAIAFKVLF